MEFYKATWRLSWKTEALMTITPTAYIGSSPWQLDLQEALLENKNAPDSWLIYNSAFSYHIFLLGYK